MKDNWGFLLVITVAGLAFVLSSETTTTPDVKECKELYQPNSPRILPCKREITLQKGQNYTLTCQAKTKIQYFKQQEVQEENVGNFSIVRKKLTNENVEYQYEVSLDLNNVDRYAIGFYACVDNTVSEKTDVLNSLIEEPSNTEHVSYIYVYVNGTDSLFAPMMEVVSGKSNSYVVECRPSTPDVEVKLFLASNKTADYLKFSPKIGFLLKTCGKIAYKCHGLEGNKSERKNLRQPRDPPQPVVIGEKEFLENETFSLNCTARYTHNSANYLHWTYPKESLKGIAVYNNNEHAAHDGFLYNNITITNATKEHAGKYTCVSENNCGERKAKNVEIEKKYLDEPYLYIKHSEKHSRISTAQQFYSFSTIVESYPKVNITIYRNNIEVKTQKKGSNFIEMKKPSEIKHYIRNGNEIVVDISKTSVNTSANYTLAVSNGFLTKNATREVLFQTGPEIKFESSDKTCVLGMKTSLECEVTGLPLPKVTWIFSSTNTTLESTRVDEKSIYKERAVLDIQCADSGDISCKANNVIPLSKNRGLKKEQNQTRRLLVYEVFDGFGIDNQTDDKTVWFTENQNALVKCLASKFDFTNVTWISDDNDDLGELVTYSDNAYSFIAKLKIFPIYLNDSGTYKCIGISINGTNKNDSILIKVAPIQKPVVRLSPNIQENVERHQSIKMSCQAEGDPRPILQWNKDGKPFTIPKNDTNVKMTNSNVNRTTVASSISISHMDNVNFGTYDCVAKSDIGEDKLTTTLILKEVAITKYLIVIAIIVFVCIMLVIYLTCKIKKEKRFRKELAAAGLLYFKEGVTKSINPDLGIDEQAELLPYDEKFEFPSEKLVLGKQLGAGAFGVVYKAEARGIINAELSTTVAVKMVKKTADNMYIKALASELKIMVHLGKHINIVNLLGACTKNVGKRELVVIVEYCKFGNIHNYMQRHREVFIDQFSDDNKEKSFGKVNRGYDSTGSTGVQSDYGTANTQETDHTFMTNNTNRTGRKISEGYVQPEWRSNYESDYSYDGRSPRPLTSRDLLAWAFQIARGMEYLASRKVLHGDLAARNILLADDNVVKICDFGLARSIYKNDEYKKTENSLLPVKWLAIECMTDRIFSTQSDVWSFGIVLWELFSLAKTPYPNINPSNLLQFLSEGHRLDKPTYSDDRVYNLMNRCWEQKPTARPTFTQLQEILGTFLEDNVRNRYVDLNKENIEFNSKPEGQRDYLDMMCSQDYEIQVTPSPHHYENEVNNARSFFPPTPTKIDEEGYLQMSPTRIFSPKPTGTKFDFDPLKFNARPSEESGGGSELTPMLTLNNLPRSGSDSDHEGNASPYLNVCPRIEEETDEVFMTKQYNAKNAQNSAVSNPTYITFDNLDVEKKPIDIKNYVNIVPNGLVK